MTVSHTSIIKNTSFLTLAYVGQKILAFLYFTFLARFLGPTDIGNYVFAISLSLILSVIVDGGVTSVIIRDVAQKKEEGAKTIQNAFFAKIVLSIVSYSILTIVAFFISHNEIIRTMILLAGVVMVLDSMNTTLWGIMRGIHKVWFESIAIIMNQVIIVVLGLLVVVLKLPLYHLVSVLVLGSFSTFIFAIRTVKKQTEYTLLGKFSFSAIISIIKESYQFALAGIFTKIYSYVDQVMLPFLASTMALGLYSVPYKITFALQFIPSAFAASLYPAMSHYAHHEPKRLGSILEKSLFFMALISFPIAAGVLVIAKPLLELVYGQAYISAVPSLQILILSLPVVFLSFPIGSLLNGSGNQKINTLNMGVTMIINVVMNLILIPRYSFIGASIAALASLVYLTFANYYFAHKIAEDNLKNLCVSIGKILLACAVMGVAVYASLMYVPLVISVLLGVVAYGCMILLLRIVHQNDVASIKAIFSKKVV